MAEQATPDHIPDHTDHKDDPGSDDQLAAVVREMRGAGRLWGDIATALNDRGLLSPTKKRWTNRTIETYAWRHGIIKPRTAGIMSS